MGGLHQDNSWKVIHSAKKGTATIVSKIKQHSLRAAVWLL
uniref:Uncharacterized protein n=1 Tax=Photobacterium damselae subsp. damselae TaxID=85581 RepID=E4WLF3_PHODD|nr:hypothetical protein [Photobacterium damselae subsp. damselae]